MGLLVTSTSEKIILIKGTEIELSNIYVRLKFTAKASGKTLEIVPKTYVSEQAYKEGQTSILTDIPQGSFTVELKLDEKQDLESAELYSKIAFEKIGYLVEVV
jgi:hypothetical protein